MVSDHAYPTWQKYTRLLPYCSTNVLCCIKCGFLFSLTSFFNFYGMKGFNFDRNNLNSV
eukprot:jgi/Botrbrau1/4312/Bobra.0232s0004.1